VPALSPILLTVAMPSPVPIQLSDAYLTQILDRPAVLQKFPQLQGLSQRARQARNATCGNCGAREKKTAQTLQQVREFILGMPDGSLDQLKVLMDVPGRQFVAWRPDSRGRNTRVLR
jgi:hypothetical protein